MKRILLTFLTLLLLFNSVYSVNFVYGEETPAYGAPYTERAGWVSMSGDSSEGQFHFSRLQQYPQPFINESGRTMFPLNHFNEIFREGLSYQVSNNTITITKNVLDVTTVVSVTLDSNILIKNGEVIVMDTVPIQRGDVIYIPLRPVSESLGYSVSWRNDIQRKAWPGGDVEFNQFQSLFAYIWNENEDSSPEGVRYSYVISEPAADLSEIKANATSDFEEVLAVIKRLPQGAGILTTLLYNIKGHKIPYEIYDETTTRIFREGYGSGSATRCLDEIPPIIKDFQDYTNEWYSEELFALDEKALYDSEKQVYRFSCFPAFFNPIVVHIEIKDDGKADVYYKEGNGESGAHSGGILRSEKAELSKQETQEFFDLLNKKDYWTMPAEIEEFGLDGHHIVIEGIKDGVYHIVDRWCPGEDDPVNSFVEYFRNLIHQKFSEQPE